MNQSTTTTSERLRGDAGGLTVEMAILTPLLLTLLIGVFELGLAWRDSLSLSNAVRAAARVASNAGDGSTADHQALVALTAALEDLPETEIRYVVIYDATGGGGGGGTTSVAGQVPEVCKTVGAATGSVGGHPDLCNVYAGDWLRSTFDPMDDSLFDGATGSPGNLRCRSGRVDRAWCPYDREADQQAAGGPDYVGIYVATNHGWVTGLFGASGIDMQDSAVMRIEPGIGD